jgi:hypothetical protein
MKRRTLVNAAGAALVAGAAGAAGAASSAGAARSAVTADATATWQLRWSPTPGTDGLGAFEGVEDDRANSHPAGQPHIFVEGDHYRFNMHLVDRDTMTDRQRQEVKGMVADGGNLILNNGETWKLTHQVFVPTALKATTSFTHIMQTKAPGTDSLPMITMSLRRHDGVEKIELVAGGVNVGMVDLVPIKNKWIDVELEMVIGDAGRVRWVLRDGATTLIDVTRSNVDIWLTDRVRPKWGIYRSLGDTSGSLQDCSMFTRNHRAYEWSGTTPPPVKTVYEAENATISQGAVESNWSGFTGTGFVNLDNVVGSYVEWTVNAPSAGLATLTFRYANGTTAARPMDIRANGTLVAAGLSFIPTPAWNDWDTRTVYNVPLAAGANKVRATSTTSTGGPNLDNLEVQIGSTSIPVTDYQAEGAVISQGAVESNHLGFTGTGFVNLDNVAGSYVEFTIAGPVSKVDIRYANGTTANRPMSVNGVTVNFPPTANWDTWAVASVPLSLGSGSQKIRLTSTTSTGGPNLDKITTS